MNSYIPVTNSKYIRGDYNSTYHIFSQIQPSVNFVSCLFKNNAQYRAVVSGGAGGAKAPQFLADQLTLSRPGGAHYPHPVLHAPPDFQTLRHA